MPARISVAGSPALPERLDQPPDEDRLRSPQRLEAVDLDLEQPERGVERVGAPGDPRAERRERLEGGLDGRPVRVGVRVDEGRLRDEPMGAPERHPPPDAQRPGLRARVDDRARIPRPAAQDERAGREGLGGSRPGELEGEVRPVEVEESHRRSVRSSIAGAGSGAVIVAEEVVAAEAGVALAALRVEDPEGRPPPRRAVAVAGDQRLRPLADDVASEPDPRPPGELEAEAGRLGDGGRQAARARPGGSSTTRSVSERRASAASRPSRSAIRAGLSVAASRPPGRSRTSRSTERPASSAPPMARPSSSVSGVMTTSHSSRMPRATASTGSKLRDRSSQATIEPGACASAASRRTSVVRPLEPSPRIATLAERGRPPGPRIASSAAKPVWMTRSSGAGIGLGRCDGVGAGTRTGAVAGARARAPSVIGAVASVAVVPATLGAAAPQRACRLATAAVTSGERVAIGRLD